jgi:hypothetical protein
LAPLFLLPLKRKNRDAISILRPRPWGRFGPSTPTRRLKGLRYVATDLDEFALSAGLRRY